MSQEKKDWQLEEEAQREHVRQLRRSGTVRSAYRRNEDEAHVLTSDGKRHVVYVGDIVNDWGELLREAHDSLDASRDGSKT